MEFDMPDYLRKVSQAFDSENPLAMAPLAGDAMRLAARGHEHVGALLVEMGKFMESDPRTRTNALFCYAYAFAGARDKNLRREALTCVADHLLNYCDGNGGNVRETFDQASAIAETVKNGFRNGRSKRNLVPPPRELLKGFIRRINPAGYER